MIQAVAGPCQQGQSASLRGAEGVGVCTLQGLSMPVGGLGLRLPEGTVREEEGKERVA